MEFRVLGPLEVAGLGVPAGVKERTLLARLLMDAGASVPVDALLAAAWSDASADAAARSLRVRLTALRAFLGPGVLVRAGGGYRVAIEPEHVDARRFERLVRDAAAQPAAAALAGYEAALALWRGRPAPPCVVAATTSRRPAAWHARRSRSALRLPDAPEGSGRRRRRRRGSMGLEPTAFCMASPSRDADWL